MPDRQELLRMKSRLSQKLANAEASLKAMQSHNVESDAHNIHRLELKVNSLKDVMTGLETELKKGKFTRAVGNVANFIRNRDPNYIRIAKESGNMNGIGQLESFIGFIDSLKNGSNDSLIESVKASLLESSAHRPYQEFSDVEEEADMSDEDYQNYLDEQLGEGDDVVEGGKDEIDEVLAAFSLGQIDEAELSRRLKELSGDVGGMGDSVGFDDGEDEMLAEERRLAKVRDNARTMSPSELRAGGDEILRKIKNIRSGGIEDAVDGGVSGTENTMGGSATGNALDAELEKLREYLKG